MTRQAAIKRWEEIIPAVFKAEDEIKPQLQRLLKQKEELGVKQTADMYCTMIAAHIVSQTTDEELNKLD